MKTDLSIRAKKKTDSRKTALGEFLMLLGILLSGKGQIERFSRKYLERMVYVIRYMQDMDGRKKDRFCYE